MSKTLCAEAEKKVVLITGGAQGIGKALSLHFLQLGYAVVACDIDAVAGDELTKEAANPADFLFVQCDVSSEESVDNFVTSAIAQFGRIDVLINNAAIANPYVSPIEELSLDTWRRVMAVNVDGPFLCTKHATPALRRTGEGSIINIASTRALMSEPNTEPYSTSKGAMVAFTHSLANSLGPNVRVNCISPGWIDVSEYRKSADRKPSILKDTDHSQHLVGRVGAPQDIASLAAFLASSSSSFITGQNFVCDGGMTKKMIYTES
eukprot:GILK01007473.1.p1 GENE.GILK01007473.1~~GILK01007473.1.p1  ORF type:complete len:277 (+),score=28.36 GILK01007473.1:41-832(+)